MVMESLEYEGTRYTRRNGKWADSFGIVACEKIQRELNRQYAEGIDPVTLSLDECVKEGDKFKSSGSVGLALKFYEYAVNRADKAMLSYILPRITSCYRRSGQPQKAIDVLTYANQTFGSDMVTPALLTSAGAAYCDLKDYKRALKCCNKAYAMRNGQADEELSLVYNRIEKETRGF